jgi:23S rRNA-/tRNA-specific pseudouridylate synthase
VVALRRAALIEAQALFAAGRVEKIYWAVVAGVPEARVGRIELALRKQSGRAGWRMVGDAAGQRAITDWRVVKALGGHAWLELRPRTGRTHQIRAHCAAMGHPILGDPVYGAGEGRLQLLARAISLPLDPPVAAEAPVPAHMAGLGII